MGAQFGYYFAKFVGKLKRDKHKETLNKWFEKQGVHFQTRGGVYNICSNISKNEPHLIWIGNNVTISGNVEFVTHDNSISKVFPGEASDLFGRIIIGENCFIGAGSVIMYGVTLADNIIVAAGSVVTRSFLQSNIVIGGNPARVLTTWDKFGEKSRPYIWNLGDVSHEEMIRKTNLGEKLVKR